MKPPINYAIHEAAEAITRKVLEDFPELTLEQAKEWGRRWEDAHPLMKEWIEKRLNDQG